MSDSASNQPTDSFLPSESAAEQLARLWQRYAERLLNVARRQLPEAQRRYADEEDVLQSALASVWKLLEQGQLHTEDDRRLWPLLKVITKRKAIDYFQRHQREKRGGGQVRGESALARRDSRLQNIGFDGVAGEQFTPEEMTIADEAVEILFARLGDETLRQIVLWKLSGETDAEIAKKLQCARSTVVRKLGIIRALWSDLAAAG